VEFRAIKPFTGGQVEDYLQSSLRADFRELIDGLHRITLTENFESFSYEGTIEAGTEVEIRNELPNPPSGRLVIKHSGSPSIVDGDTEWTSDFVYLKNAGASAATVKVIYFT